MYDVVYWPRTYQLNFDWGLKSVLLLNVEIPFLAVLKCISLTYQLPFKFILQSSFLMFSQVENVLIKSLSYFNPVIGDIRYHNTVGGHGHATA